MLNTSVVHIDHPHILNRGDRVERKYDATYHFGKTVVHIVAPPPMTDEAKEKILRELQLVEWKVWNKFSVEKRLRLNEEWAAESAAAE